nr:zinc finger protein 791-like [Maniola hyperantus]
MRKAWEQEDRIVKNKESVKKCTQLEKLLTVLIDDPKGPGFPCLQCRQYFRSKNLRNKHVQKCHSEGFQCPTCGKKFPLKDTLRKHEMIHCNPRPRQPCQVCGKMVRLDLVRVHGLSHFSGKQYSCVPCDKTFNSPYSYQTHLKYSRQHAERAALKYKCSVCGKDYRSPGELRDHHNYAHESKTIHKCPICQTALATARGVKNHVKRAHEEKTIIRNKICQTCGKAFIVSYTRYSDTTSKDATRARVDTHRRKANILRHVRPRLPAKSWTVYA